MIRVRFWNKSGMESRECGHVEIVGNSIALFDIGRGDPHTRIFVMSVRLDACDKIDVIDLRFGGNAAGEGAPVSLPGYLEKRFPQ